MPTNHRQVSKRNITNMCNCVVFLTVCKGTVLCNIPDCCWSDFLQAAAKCVNTDCERKEVMCALQKMWTHSRDRRSVLPALSVRTALDLYLRVMNFPPGSEIIMSAINIPDMVEVVHHHKLKVVSLDISLESTAPKIEWLEELLSERTVCILIAYIYGKWFDCTPIIDLAKKHDIPVIEDCAEGFCGFDRLGHPEAVLSLFSFGVIKYCTAFGGAIAKVRDAELYNQMLQLQETYPVQSRLQYLYKVCKYSVVYILLNCPRFMKPGYYVLGKLGVDHKKYVVNMLRGFPHGLITKIRQQPSTPLLEMMYTRMSEFCHSEFSTRISKGEYVVERLDHEKATPVGNKASVNNYWLFPLVVVSGAD